MKFEIGTEVLVDLSGIRGEHYGLEEGVVSGEVHGMTLVHLNDEDTFVAVKDDLLEENHFDDDDDWDFDDDDDEAHSFFISIDGDKVIATDGKHTGIARCNPKDIFDPEVGATLALRRMFDDSAYGDEYFYISDAGKVLSKEFNNSEFDKTHKEYGNFFKSKEDAKKAAENIRKTLRGE